MNTITDSSSIPASANHDLLINAQNQPDLYPLSHTHPLHPNPNPSPHPHPNPQPRRPRGFAATAAAAASDPATSTTPSPINVSSRGKREREKEKERTKLRERHRRAITSRMLAGLRQYGNFPLPARADMNDVLAALAREAGWTVEPDGSTYRQSSPSSQLPTFAAVSSSSLKKGAAENALECQASVLRIDATLSPASLDSVVITERESSKYRPSVDCLDAEQLMHNDADFSATPYVPVYAMLGCVQNGFMNVCGQLVDPPGIRQELSHIKSLDVDGVAVECWWGIVEAWSPQKYVWSGYRELFNIIRDFKLKLQVIMAFHEYEGNDSTDVMISLPHWVIEIGKENKDIFFTDREGRRNTECLSWGIDKERVLKGRTGIEVYFDFMRSFRTEFHDLFVEGLISAIEIGLGPSGDLKYPSFSERMGWRYPGIGEFQCYDKYLQQNLRKAAKLRGHSAWARGPDNAGQYNSRPHETGFFCERGDYDSYYGRFFLHWYSQSLVDHADNVLSLASLAFEDTKLIVKIPAVYWWYKTTSHAAELVTGYYNPTNQDGYSPIVDILKKHSVTMKFVCSGVQVTGHGNDEAFADPEALSWQVLNSAWDRGLAVAGVNLLSCYNREGYMRVVNMAKPRNDDDPDRHHFSFFVYQQPSPLATGTICFPELDYFVKCMHGEISGDL